MKRSAMTAILFGFLPGLALAETVQTSTENGKLDWLSQDLRILAGDWIGEICTGWIVLLMALYFGVVVFFRYIWVIEPSFAKVRAKRVTLHARMLTLQEWHAGNTADSVSHNHVTNGIVTGIDDLLERSLDFVPDQKIIPEEGKPPVRETLRRICAFVARMFAFTGRQYAAWNILHDVERYLFLDETYARNFARSYALTALAKLNRVPDVPVRLRDELFKTLEKGTKGKDIHNELVPLVREARAYIFAYEDDGFAALADAKNKGLLLLLLALFTMWTVIFLFPDTLLVIVGGMFGAVLARLRLALRNETPEFDYSLSWSVIFLSPIVGGLTGWVGVLLVEVLNEVKVAGSAIESIRMNDPTGWSFLAALLFGLSSTLFDNYLQRIEGQMDSVRQDAKRQSNRANEADTGAIALHAGRETLASRTALPDPDGDAPQDNDPPARKGS